MKELTIIIPNYKTYELTKLCFDSLKKNSDLSRLEIIAIDNDSADDSLEYLRSLDYITLIERTNVEKHGARMHARALDIAFEQCKTPYVLVIHTDTIFLEPNWMDFTLKFFKDNENCAGVGSWKLDEYSRIKAFGKKIEAVFNFVFKGKRGAEPKRYLRSHFAMYKTDIIRKHTKGFADNDTAGRSLHNYCEEAGFDMKFLSSKELSKYIVHFNHATAVLNPTVGSKKTSSARSQKKYSQKFEKLKREIYS